jgi:hypothetical protein
MSFENIKPGYYCGVDPGADGAIVELLYCDGPHSPERWYVQQVDRLRDYDFSKQPDRTALRSKLHAYNTHAHHVTGVERVQGMPRQSGPASFNFGRNYGFLLGALLDEEKTRSFHHMPKSAWAFLVGIPFDKRDDKKAAVELAVRLVPDLVKYKNRAGNVPDGIAEAALIAIAAAIQESKTNAIS